MINIGTWQTFIDRTGENIVNNQGLNVKIISSRKYSDIDVIFDDGTVLNHKRYDHFKTGSILNPMYPNVYNKGYFGIGKYVARYKGMNTGQYQTWHSMMCRCYSETQRDIRPTYKNCTVCDEWLNYQNFAKWYDENYYALDGEVMCLDKDILIKGNKIYSPDTCIFVPNRINVLFIKTNKCRGNYPIGVHYNKLNNNYRAQINLGKRVMLGSFKTAEEAFMCYKIAKEKQIKQIADEYKDMIPKQLYCAMYNYKVDIND